MAFYDDVYTRNGSHSQNTNDDAFDNMYPALIQCFGIIILGYISGRLGVINKNEAKGLSKFALNATLPAFVFRAIVLVDFSKVTWKFVLVVSFAKILLFVAVSVLTMLFTRNIGKAGIYGVFCTVSNDLAMGIPVLKAMYKDDHKEFIDCLYFLVLISFVILTPIGILMMEYEKQRTFHSSSTFRHILYKTFKNLLLQPVIIGSIFGIPFNFILNQDIPSSVQMFLDSLSEAFPAAALFYLGLIVVGKIKTQVGMAILIPLSLVSAKVLVLPFLIRALLDYFNVGGSKMNGDWKIFGFIYGTIPPAPTSVVFAGLFGFQEDMLASTLMMATAFSAPVIFSSSKMATVYHMNLTQQYTDLVMDTRNSTSFVAIGLASWTLIVLISSGRYKCLPHKYTICLTITQLLFCVSLVLTKSEKFMHNKRLACFLIATFLLATHCWTAAIAINLARIRCCQNTDTVFKKTLLFFFGWGLPLCCSSVVLAGSEREWGNFSWNKQDFFYFMQKQVIFSTFWVIILFVCVFLCISTLVVLHRCDKYCKCLMYKEEVKIDEKTPLLSQRYPSRCHQCSKSKVCSSSTENSCVAATNSCDIEDIDVGHVRPKRELKNDNEKRKLILQNYYEGEKHQRERHIIVIVCQILLFILCIFYSMWILVGDEQRSGIFLEVEILVSIVVSGQVLVTFAMFGFERAFMIDPLLQRLRHYWYNVNEVILPKREDLSADEYLICKQFVNHHKQHCARDLNCHPCSVESGSTERSVNHENNIFFGRELVNWLLEVGLVSDRLTAIKYGNSLLKGRVIQHVNKLHYFTDSELQYQFCSDWDGRTSQS